MATIKNPQQRAYHCSVCGQSGHNARRHLVVTEKQCPDCKRVLPIAAFYPTNRKGKNTQWYRCAKCDRAECGRRYRGSFRGRLVALLGSARARSKTNNMAFDITTDFLMELLQAQGQKCYYSQRSLTYNTGNSAVSIDRIDPTGGYTKGNIALTQWVVNNMKCNLSPTEFRAICSDIARGGPVRPVARKGQARAVEASSPNQDTTSCMSSSIR